MVAWVTDGVPIPGEDRPMADSTCRESAALTGAAGVAGNA